MPEPAALAAPVVWFDFGGVLSPPQDELFAAYERKSGISARQLSEALRRVSEELGEPALAALELGRISEPDWGARLRRALAATGADLSRARLERFGEQWFEGHQADPAMCRAVALLRGLGHRVGILSNNVREWEPFWRALVAPAGEFAHVVDSNVVGVRKPDPRIFKVAEAAAGATASACVLVDDLHENVAAALTAGWHAVHFRTAAQALTELAALLGVRELADLAG